MNLSSHTVFITGGSAGIGLALAKAFADAGSKVIICGRDKTRLDTVLNENSRFHGFVCDVMRPNAPEYILKTMAKNNWRPSILTNNAGVGRSVNVASEPLQYLSEQVIQQMRTNVEAPMLLTMALLPLLKEHQEAAIINITSGLAIAPTRSSPIYCATKAALRSFTKSLRYQLKESCKNIKVIEVLPPVVDTEMMKRSNHSKISPAALAAEVVDGVKCGKTEIYAGKVKLLKLIYDISPALAQLFMRNW